MVVSGHTHQPYVCNIKDPAGQPRLVTSASSFGRLVTETNFKYDRRTQDIVRSSVAGSNLLVDRTTCPRTLDQTSLIGHYKTLVTPIASKVLGHDHRQRHPDARNAAGESQLGDLIADAQLADPSIVTGGQTPVIAFMNPGGIRADLTYASSPKWGEAPGDVTYEESFTVQPFNNYLVSLTLTGQQIKTLLTQQWHAVSTRWRAPKILQVTKGFTYTIQPSTPGRPDLGR